MNLDYFASLLTEYWFILVPLLLISGVSTRKKESKARALQVSSFRIRRLGFFDRRKVAFKDGHHAVFGLLIR